MLVKAFFRASLSSFTPSGHRFVCVHGRHNVIDELWKFFGGIVDDVFFKGEHVNLQSVIGGNTFSSYFHYAN